MSAACLYVCVCVCVCVRCMCMCLHPRLCVFDSYTRLCRCVCLCLSTPTDYPGPLEATRQPPQPPPPDTHTHTHTHTLFLHSSPHVCSLLRALIWLAVICFVKQWSIWLTGGALHSAHTLLWTHAGVLRQTRTKTCTGYMHMSTLRIRHGFLKISPTLPPSFTCAVEWLTEAM